MTQEKDKVSPGSFTCPIPSCRPKLMQNRCPNEATICHTKSTAVEEGRTHNTRPRTWSHPRSYVWERVLDFT